MEGSTFDARNMRDGRDDENRRGGDRNRTQARRPASTTPTDWATSGQEMKQGADRATSGHDEEVRGSREQPNASTKAGLNKPTDGSTSGDDEEKEQIGQPRATTRMYRGPVRNRTVARRPASRYTQTGQPRANKTNKEQSDQPRTTRRRFGGANLTGHKHEGRPHQTTDRATSGQENKQGAERPRSGDEEEVQGSKFDRT